MINGMYNSASGMNAELIRQDVVANNLANVSTLGFKKDQAVMTSFPNTLVQRIHDKMRGSMPAFMSPQPAPVVGVVGHGVQTHSVVTSFRDGSLTRTDRPLDLALKGDALFTVEAADGSRAYTRAGNFTLDSQGRISTQNGELVLGVGNEPININGKLIAVDETGRVNVDGRETGRLLIQGWEADKFAKKGENLFVRLEQDIEVAPEESGAQNVNAKVLQGYVEEANVRVVEEMVNLITVSRAYESNQKVIQIQDETLDKVINQVGRPS